MSPADPLQRDLARALTAKAHQFEVADPPPTVAPAPPAPRPPSRAAISS